ncbi:nucleoid-associated protein [Clostridium perfringens]|nr:nucleoid-associated protein [Clostridium perfringens]
MGRIQFEGIIVHSLDNKNNNKKLSDFLLENYTKIEPQLVRHIQRSQKHDNRKIAYFIGENNIVKNSCEKIFKDSGSFIEESKVIAEHLFSCMLGNASPANLIICKYLEDDVHKIALLKMDFNEIFTPIEKEVEGKLKIELELIDKSLPSKNEKLQKCVFISEEIFLDKSDEKHILLLDKQRGKTVSEFFSKDFLGCELKNTDNQNLSKFMHHFTKYLNEAYDTKPELKEHLLKEFKNILCKYKGKIINVPDIIGELYIEQEEREQVIEDIGKNEDFDFEFIINEDYLKGRMHKVKYVTTSGITLSGDGDVFRGDNFEIKPIGDEGFVDIIIKNVKYDFSDT